jgi:hypothetical protein
MTAPPDNGPAAQIASTATFVNTREDASRIRLPLARVPEK